MVTEENWKLVYEREEKNIGRPQFQPHGVKYALVASEDITVNHVHFKAGEIVKMTGLLAKNCIKNGGGKVQLYNPTKVKAQQEKAELEQLKQKVAELSEGKKTPVEDISEEVKAAKPKKEKTTKKKGGMTTSKDVPGGSK